MRIVQVMRTSLAFTKNALFARISQKNNSTYRAYTNLTMQLSMGSYLGNVGENYYCVTS